MQRELYWNTEYSMAAAVTGWGLFPVQIPLQKIQQPRLLERLFRFLAASVSRRQNIGEQPPIRLRGELLAACVDREKALMLSFSSPEGPVNYKSHDLFFDEAQAAAFFARLEELKSVPPETSCVLRIAHNVPEVSEFQILLSGKNIRDLTVAVARLTAEKAEVPSLPAGQASSAGDLGRSPPLG